MSLKNLSQSGKGPPLWLQAFIVAITVIVVCIIIFLGRQNYRETKKIATEQFNQHQLILARSAATGIEAYFRDLCAALLSLAKLPTIQQMTPLALQCIQYTQRSLPSRTSIRLLDSNGILQIIYPFEGWRGGFIGSDYSKEDYFENAKETGQISISNLIVNEQGEIRIRIAAPVYLTHKTKTVKVGKVAGIIITPVDSSKPVTGRFCGIVVGSFDPHTIVENFIFPIVSGKSGYAWLLNEDGIFISHYEKGFTYRDAFEVRREKNPKISHKEIKQIQRKMMEGEEAVGRYISGLHRGKKGKIEKLIAYTPMHINGDIYSVAVCAPVSEVEEIIHIAKRSEYYTLGFVILALIIGGIFFFIISHRWSHSLELEVAKKTRELRETSDYLNNLIRYANAPIIVWDPDKRVTIFNEAFEKMSGWTEEEIMEQSLDVLFPEETRSDSLEKINNASKGEYWETVEIPILKKDGEIRMALWNSANIYSEDGKTLLATIAQGQDITERKRMEGEILKASKLESIGILAGGIAHDFNNILTAIIGNISLAEMSADPKSEIFKELRDAEKAALRAKDLTQQLLTFSRGGVPVKETTSITEVIKDTVSFILRGSNVKCEFSIPDDVWPVEVDIGQINQVISNLIINADQSMPEGGLIKVDAGNITVVGKEHALPLEKGRYLNLSIADEGIGISAEHLKRIFDPYFTTKQKDSGLGLAISYSIIKSHGGYITVESKLGVGTTFHIYLPASSEEILKKQGVEEKLIAGTGKILLMDDEEAVRNIGGKLLEKIGYKVEFASDGGEAIKVYEKALESTEPFDAIIMDLTVPGEMGGKETIKEILKIDPDVKAIVSSGYSNAPVMANFKKYGFSGVITKPYNIIELSKILHGVIQRGQVFA